MPSPTNFLKLQALASIIKRGGAFCLFGSTVLFAYDQKNQIKSSRLFKELATHGTYSSLNFK